MNRRLNSKIPATLHGLRARLFSSAFSSVVTLAILYLAWKMIPPLVDWALVQAVWSPENPAPEPRRDQSLIVGEMHDRALGAAAREVEQELPDPFGR